MNDRQPPHKNGEADRVNISMYFYIPTAMFWVKTAFEIVFASAKCDFSLPNSSNSLTIHYRNTQQISRYYV